MTEELSGLVSSTLLGYQSGEVKSMSISTHLWLGSTPVSGSTSNESGDGLSGGVPLSFPPLF